MHLIQRARCAFGRHARDRKAAHFDGSVWRSRCTGCGRPMVREFEGWQVTER